MRCPKCKAEKKQYKDRFTQAGSQHYRCREYGARYTPEPKPQGYSQGVCQLAIGMYADGLGFRQISRQLKLSHSTDMEWGKTHAEQLPDASMPEEVDTVEVVLLPGK